jgi:hypothetical protein
MVELAGFRRDEHQHVAIDARRTAALREDVLRFDQRLRAVAPIMRIFDAQHDGAHAARFVGDFSRCGRRDLHGIEMPAISEAVHIFSEFGIDRHIDQRRLDLRRLVRCDPVEARRHRVPVTAKIGMHELGLVGQPPQRIAEDRWTLAGLHDAEIDLLIVEAGVLLLRRGRGSHENRARRAGSPNSGSGWAPTDRPCKGWTPCHRHRRR